MYAIVDIGGKQFQVTQKMRLKVPRLNTEPGKKVQFDRVLLFEDDKGNVSFGDPLLKNMNIDATLISHGRDKKVVVFKKKRRKGYRVKRGHRQDFSLIEITAIGTGTKVQKTAAKTEEKPPAKETAAAKAAPARAKKAPVQKKSATAKKTTPAKTTKATDEKKTAAPVKKAAPAKKAEPKKTQTKAKAKTAEKKPAAKKAAKEDKDGA